MESSPSNVYLFIGQSGCGKGTQVTLLEQTFTTLSPDKKIFHLETGKKFREMIATDTYSARLTKKIITEGKLPPPFLGVHMWAHVLMEEYNGEDIVFIDGTPRVPSEVPLLLSACAFYGWHPHLINILVSDEWSYERMKARGRADDQNEQDLWGRIQWFHESVVPAINLFRESPLITVHDIHGEQSIEVVHADICQALGLVSASNTPSLVDNIFI